jgi:lipopolysaccharide export system protein LptA
MMKRRVGALIAAGVMVVAVVIVAAAVVSNKRQQAAAPPPPLPKPKLAEGPQRLEMSGVQLQDFDQAGKLRWRIKSSGKLEFDRAKLIARGKDIQFEVMGADKRTILLSAPEFLIDYHGKKAALSKGVTAKASDGSNFSAQAVTYDLAQDRLRAQGPVKAHWGDFDFRAGALGLARLSRVADFVGGVTLKYKDYTVTAAKVQADGAKRTATLRGSPKVTRGPYVATAGAVTVDAVAEEARLSGGVDLRRGELQATADSAALRKEPERAELDGDVRLEGRGFSTTGGHLVVDGRSSTAAMTGGTRTRVKVRR